MVVREQVGHLGRKDGVARENIGGGVSIHYTALMLEDKVVSHLRHQFHIMGHK